MTAKQKVLLVSLLLALVLGAAVAQEETDAPERATEADTSKAPGKGLNWTDLAPWGGALAAVVLVVLLLRGRVKHIKVGPGGVELDLDTPGRAAGDAAVNAVRESGAQLDEAAERAVRENVAGAVQREIWTYIDDLLDGLSPAASLEMRAALNRYHMRELRTDPKEIKRLLAELDYEPAVDETGGYNDNVTEVFMNAVMEFQRHNRDRYGDRLLVDGIVGPETYRSMRVKLGLPAKGSRTDA